jgi:hypothetical protein
LISNLTKIGALVIKLCYYFISISVNCVQGKYKEGDECVVCKAGTYKSEVGNDECTPCPDGFTTDTVTGATSATQCDTGIHFLSYFM